MKKLLAGCGITFLALILLAGTFSGGFLVGRLLPEGTLANTPFNFALPGGETPTPQGMGDGNNTAPANVQELFAPFWETWDIVHNNYVDQPVDDTALMRGAIRGMLEALGDEHTTYMDPQEYTDANTALAGNYEGIGAYVDTGGEYLTVTSPIPGSPAEAAGLQPGDKILKIDGEDMTGIQPELARRKVLGPAGTTVILTIGREGVEPFDVAITRARIEIPSVESEMRADNIAYVRLNTFGDTTTTELKNALKDLMAQNPKGLILDLRYNGGGYLQTAVEVASQFLPQGKVALIEQFGDGSQDDYKTIGGGLATDIPMVVLINKGSASASEIVAGALQDYGRAQLVGETSYGKGSVQNWIPLDNNQGAVRVTIAKWLTPNGRTIHKLGLTPDVVVELTEEDAKADRDPQLDKAVEILLGK